MFLFLNFALSQSQNHQIHQIQFYHYNISIKGFCGRIQRKIYCERMMCELGELVKPLENVIRFIFIPSISGRHICSDNEHKLLSLPTRHGDLAVPLYHEIVSFEYEKFMKLIFLPNLIKDQSKVYHVSKTDQVKIKSDILFKRETRYKNILNELHNNMSESQIQLNNMSQTKGI